jgi:VWFA-related protein
MRNFRLQSAVAQAAICVVVWAVAAAPTQAQEVWHREISEAYGVLLVRNAAGRTTVTSRSAGSIQVVAERTDGSPHSANSVKVEAGAPGVLTITIPPDQPATLLDLTVPANTHVSIQGGAGTVLVQGALGGLSVETATGPIVLQLPPEADADVAMKSAGEIVSTLQLVSTGTGGRLGRGGARYDLKSASGKIFLLAHPGTTTTRPTPQLAERNAPDSATAPGKEVAQPVQRISRSGARITPPRGSGAAISVTSQMVLANVSVGIPDTEKGAVLAKEDFAVLDEGQPQQISYFAPVDEPLDLILLLDLSGSTKSKFNLIKKAAERFIAVLNPQDRVALAGFTSRFLLVSDFTADRKVLQDRLKRMKHPEGGTKFYRAMWLSLDMMTKVKGSRKAIVVMTDGVDNALQGAGAMQSPGVRDILAALTARGRERLRQQVEDELKSETDFEALLERITADGVSVYPVYLNTEYEMVVRQGRSDSTDYQEAREQLQAVAEVCGTTVIKADRIEDLDGAYAGVAAELRNLYTIGFYPTDAKQSGAWHELGVTVNRPGYTARTRRGYYVD